MSPETSADIVREFWRLMATNDFTAVAAVLADDFVLEWPQSRERIRGPGNFAQMNAEYPGQGPWRFRIERLVAGPTDVVTEVSVTDGVRMDRAISFFALTGERISRIVEYWPEPFPAPAHRAHLVEMME